MSQAHVVLVDPDAGTHRTVGHGDGGDVFVADDRGHVMLQLEDARRIPGESVDYHRQDMRRLHLDH